MNPPHLPTAIGSGASTPPGLTLTPRLSFKRQEPYYPTWDSDEARTELLDTELYLQQTVMRTLANMTLSWDVFARANLLVGVEAFYDRGDRVGNEPDAESGNSYTNDAGELIPTISFVTSALFAQFLWPNEYVNLTAGGRLEVHSVFGAFAVPRLALTKVFDSGLHAKLLASQAFRTPSLQNKRLEKKVDPNNEIARERIIVFEAEVGYRIMDGLQFTANGFFTMINDPFIYVYDEDVDDETSPTATTRRSAM